MRARGLLMSEYMSLQELMEKIEKQITEINKKLEELDLRVVWLETCGEGRV